MPILQFSDVKSNRQTYDFTEMSLCRLAAIYVSFREISENNELPDEIQQNCNIFAGYFQALQGTLNELVVATNAFASNDAISSHDRISITIDIEHWLRDLTMILMQLTQNITAEKLQLMLGGANQHLIDNILNDLNMLLSIVKIQSTNFMSMPSTVENLLQYITSLQTSDMRLLYQLRDFLNIYLNDPVHKPTTSLPSALVGTAREYTRLGAGFFGSILGTTARAVGLDVLAVQSADAWLQSWNDKYKPLELSRAKNGLFAS